MIICANCCVRFTAPESYERIKQERKAAGLDPELPCRSPRGPCYPEARVTDPDALRALARELAHVLAGCADYGDFNPKVPLDTDVCWTDDPACLRGDTEGWCSGVRDVLARAVQAGLFD